MENEYAGTRCETWWTNKGVKFAFGYNKEDGMYWMRYTADTLAFEEMNMMMEFESKEARDSFVNAVCAFGAL